MNVRKRVREKGLVHPQRSEEKGQCIFLPNFRSLAAMSRLCALRAHQSYQQT